MGLNLCYEQVYISNRLYHNWKKNCIALLKEFYFEIYTEIYMYMYVFKKKKNTIYSIDLTASGLLHWAKKIGDK